MYILFKFISDLQKNKIYKIEDLYHTEIILKNSGSKNLTIDFNPYYTAREQRKGEKDIIALAKKNKLIESEWYFLKDNNLWISTALSSPLRYNPQTGECQVSVRGFYPPLAKFPDREITYYHFHTYGMYKNIRKNFICAGETKEQAALKAFLEIAVPTPKDLKSFSHLKDLYTQKNMSFRIGTFEGITQINIKRELSKLDNSFLTITKNLDNHQPSPKNIYEYFELINKKYQDYFELIFLKP